MRRALVRRWFARLHSWIGAIAALFLIAVALSGAALASVAWWFRWQYGAMLDAPGAGATDLDQMIANASAGRVGFRVAGVLMPHSRVDIDAALVFGFHRGDGPEDVHMIAVNPHTSAVQGDFALSDAIGHEIIHFHSQLFAGEVGGLMVAVLGVLLALFAASGVYLWWPRRGALAKATRLSLRGRATAALFRLHGFAGVWAALVVMYFALTGIGTARPGWLGIDGLPYDPPAAIAASRCNGRVSPTAAARAAEAAQPGARIATLYMSPGGEGYRISLKRAGDLDSIGGDLVVFASATCPGVAASIAASGTTTLANAALALHGGRTLGPVGGGVLVALGGLVTALLAGSGLYVWATRTFKRRRPRVVLVPGAQPAE